VSGVFRRDPKQQLDGQYSDMIPSDGFLVERFEKRLKSKLSDYAPLRVKDAGRG